MRITIKKTFITIHSSGSLSELRTTFGRGHLIYRTIETRKISPDDNVELSTDGVSTLSYVVHLGTGVVNHVHLNISDCQVS